MVTRGIGVKPTRPELNRDHSLARDILICVPFQDRGGTTFRDTSGLSGPHPEDSASTHLREAYGGAASFAASSTHVDLGTDNRIGLPTHEATICVIYEKNDGTNRSSGLFGHDSGAGLTRIGAHAPFSDGTVYWDFGGSGGSNRLTSSGQTFERAVWVYTAGPNGMSIWKNGSLLASSATAVTRVSATTTTYGLGRHGGTNGDNVTYHYFCLFTRQITSSEVVAFSGNPFALITSTIRKTYFVPTVAEVAPGAFLRRYEGQPAPNLLLRL